MKKSFKRILPTFVLFALLFSFSLAFAINAEAKNSNDYSRPGYSDAIYNESYDSVRFLREKLTVSVGNAESEYLVGASDFRLSYPKNIPSSYISLEPTQNGKQMFVFALSYYYTNSEGVSITWTPIRVTCGSASQAFKLSRGKYEAMFMLDSIEKGLAFVVEYSATISVPKAEVNRELSRAYLDAKYFDYLEKQLEYESALEIYKNYLSDKKIYDELYLEYTEYLSDLEKYNEQLSRYEEYLKALSKYESDYVIYLESLKTAEELADEIRAYEEYLAKMEKIKHRISLVEDMKTKKSSLDRSIFIAITGGAVDQVLAEQDLLTGNVIGADKAVVEGAGDATREIREFYDGYFSRTTEASKYLYYQINYQKLATNIVKLFKCLDNLYANDQIKGIIASKERSEKFEILLAQLYLASKALSDTPISDYSGATSYEDYYAVNTTYGSRTPEQLLGDISGYFVDKNMATPPSDEAYPDVVYKPDYTPVSEPKKPEKVSKPTPPTAVAEPSLPTPVDEPKAPTYVENVNSVTKKAPFAENSLEARLLEAYRSGALSERLDRYLTKDYSLTLTIPVNKIYGADKLTVTAHDREGIPQYDASVDSGSFAEIAYVPASYQSADGKYSYHFETWVDDKGNSVDLSAVTRDLRIYPRFKEEINKFKISFKLGDEVISEEVLPWGEVPVCPVSPEKAPELNKYYSFIGWSSEILPVTEDASYTALFEEHCTVPGLSDGSITESGEDEISVNCGALLGEKIDVSRLLEIAAGKYSVKFVFALPENARTVNDSLAEFTVSYAEIMAMKKNSVAYLKFVFTLENADPTVIVDAFDADGEKDESDYKISAAIPSDKTHEDMRVVYYLNGEKLYAKSQYSDGKIRFNLNTGSHYSYVLELFPSLISVISQNITVAVDKSEALPGESVSVNIEVPPGYELISLYYLDSLGGRVTIEGGSFIMPNSDVSVGAELKRIVYTVNFVSDGMVISTKKYYYGDTVEIPEGLEKAGDGSYSYKFLRWAPTVDVVTKDVNYNAVYEKTPIVREEVRGLKISEGTLRILIIAGIFAVVTLLGIFPNIIIAIVLIIRRRRRGTAILRKRRKRKVEKS